MFIVRKLREIYFLDIGGWLWRENTLFLKTEA